MNYTMNNKNFNDFIRHIRKALTYELDESADEFEKRIYLEERIEDALGLCRIYSEFFQEEKPKKKSKETTNDFKDNPLTII